MRPLPVLLLSLLLAACVPPIPPGERLLAVGTQGAAPDRAAGVVLLADAWPEQVSGRRIAPLLVTVINTGDRPIRLDPALFILAPDHELAAAGSQPPAPVLLPLPPPAGLRHQALPQGTLPPGETARGVVVFPNHNGGGDLILRLVNADDGSELGLLHFPFLPPAQ